jgi:predicted AlkP superfamily phosphohydrolase/phosphomutase
VLLMIGLDCAPPALVFDRLRAHLPCLSSLMSAGAYGTLRSTIPPITMPAWACMMSGRDPGELGIYGFRDRIEGTRRLRTATAEDVRAPRVWDVAGDRGLRSCVMYVPPTWPPRALRGEMVSCLLTPGPDREHTYPSELAGELARFGAHTPDAVRQGTAEEVLEALHEAAAQHFDVAEHMIATRRPDLAVMVEMGTDRLHHAMWPALDPGDPRHDPASPLVRGARDFYGYLDARIARLIDRAGRDANVMIVSDHGARSLRGGVYVNEWLRREGWLVLRSDPERTCAIEHADVDWARTRAWAEGGYYARIVMNTRARFADGAIDEGDLEAEIERLGASARAIAPGTRAIRPRDVYRQTTGTPPDLMLFLGDLELRALGEIRGGAPDERALVVGAEEAGASRAGRASIADGCNHDWDGIYIVAGPDVPRLGRRDGRSIHDVGATALALLGVPRPDGWLGGDLRSEPS